MSSARPLDLYESVCMIAMRMPKELPFKNPDDDWEPVLFMQDREENQSTIAMGPFMGDAADKQMLATVALPAMINMFEATRIVMVMSTWTADVPRETDLSTVQPSKLPNRIEKLLVMELDCNGVQRVAFAPILRDGVNPPSLGEWEPTEGFESFVGRFVDPLVAALRTA